MGSLIYFCAGASMDILPGKGVNALLLNVPDNGASARAIKDSKNLVRACTPKYVMVDSGGYQLLKGEEEGLEMGFNEEAPVRQPGRINLTPWHVIRAAVNLKPNILIALDFPIAKIPEKEKQEIEFHSKLGFNVDWAIKTAELRKKHSPEIRLFIPVQCYSLRNFELFSRLIRGIEFDGYSMPVRNLSLAEITLFLVRFYQIGIRQIHLLGVSSFFTIALCAYMARHLFEWVSLDARSWTLQAEHNSFMNPHDLSPEFLGKDVMIDESIQLDCECPWCRGKTFTYIKHLPFTERTHFLRCHNHWVIEKAVSELSQNSGNLQDLRRFLRKRSSNQKTAEELCRCLSVADAFKDRPVEQWMGLLDANS